MELINFGERKEKRESSSGERCDDVILSLGWSFSSFDIDLEQSIDSPDLIEREPDSMGILKIDADSDLVMFPVYQDRLHDEDKQWRRRRSHGNPESLVLTQISVSTDPVISMEWPQSFQSSRWRIASFIVISWIYMVLSRLNNGSGLKPPIRGSINRVSTLYSVVCCILPITLNVQSAGVTMHSSPQSAPFPKLSSSSVHPVCLRLFCFLPSSTL